MVMSSLKKQFGGLLFKLATEHEKQNWSSIENIVRHGAHSGQVPRLEKD